MESPVASMGPDVLDTEAYTFPLDLDLLDPTAGSLKYEDSIIGDNSLAYAVEQKASAAALWTGSYSHYGFYVTFIYLLLIYAGQRAMKQRPAYGLNTTLTLWNAGLAVFSIAGSIFVVPELVQSLVQGGVRGSYCSVGEQFKGPAGTVQWLFMLSKTVELGDTAFLVLRKRPVIFLHWYHHVVVVLFAFYQYQYQVASSRWGAAMNLVVHSFMYTYYMLKAAHISLPKSVSIAITSMQILQMIVGSAVCSLIMVELLAGRPCTVLFQVGVWQFLMYLSFLVLFCHLFKQLYFTKRAKKTV